MTGWAPHVVLVLLSRHPDAMCRFDQLSLTQRPRCSHPCVLPPRMFTAPCTDRKHPLPGGCLIKSHSLRPTCSVQTHLPSGARSISQSCSTHPCLLLKTLSAVSTRAETPPELCSVQATSDQGCQQRVKDDFNLKWLITSGCDLPGIRRLKHL